MADQIVRVPVFEVPDRQFQVCDFMMTHTKLIMQAQAVPEAGQYNRIEVLFQNIKFMSFPPIFRGLRLREAPEDQSRRLVEMHGLENAKCEIYLLHEDKDWFIASGVPQWVEADRDYDDPSVFFGSKPDARPILERGKLIRSSDLDH